MVDLPEKKSAASIAFTNVRVDYFGLFTIKIGRMNKKDVVVCSHVKR